MNGSVACFERETNSEKTAMRFQQGLCSTTIHLFCYWFWLLILICNFLKVQLCTATFISSTEEDMMRHLRQQGSNLVNTPWAESKMVTVGCDRGYQKPSTYCWEWYKDPLQEKNATSLWVADCNPHIPHQISRQTTKSLGLEKDLFVHFTQTSKNKKALYNGCGVAV